MGYVVLWILMVPRCGHLLSLVQDIVIALSLREGHSPGFDDNVAKILVSIEAKVISMRAAYASKYLNFSPAGNTLHSRPVGRALRNVSLAIGDQVRCRHRWASVGRNRSMADPQFFLYRHVLSQRATVSAKNPRMIPFRFTTNPVTSEGIRIHPDAAVLLLAMLLWINEGFTVLRFYHQKLSLNQWKTNTFR